MGADSTELGIDLAAFAPAYAEAAALGFRRTCRAGEAAGVGPENVRIALDVLGAERIDHGVAIVEDPILLARLARERIPLTVCPTSNVVIANRFRSLEEHPLVAMRDGGLLVTINTDDPAMTRPISGKSTAWSARRTASTQLPSHSSPARESSRPGSMRAIAQRWTGSSTPSWPGSRPPRRADRPSPSGRATISGAGTNHLRGELVGELVVLVNLGCDRFACFAVSEVRTPASLPHVAMWGTAVAWDRRTRK